LVTALNIKYKLQESLLILYQIPKRDSQLNSLRTKKFDVLVIGGGAIGNINTFLILIKIGSGIAADAQLRGLSVALIEKDDFGSGTSGRTSKCKGFVHDQIFIFQYFMEESNTFGDLSLTLIAANLPSLLNPFKSVASACAQY
jgi:hypothetical protein